MRTDGFDPVSYVIGRKTGYAAGKKAGGGGGAAADPDKPVRFYDYDGTLVASYTAEEFAALDALPANPAHEGLTAQGWNWTLADAKEQVASGANWGKLIIGQMYITSDGKTRVYIHLEEERKSPYMQLKVNGTVTVDWGDGTQADTVTGSTLDTFVSVGQHSYASGGDYVITIDVQEGSNAYIAGLEAPGSYLLYAGNSSSLEKNAAYHNAIKKVEIGARIQIVTFAFEGCYSLKTITIPIDGMQSTHNKAFYYCYSLVFLTYPAISQLTQIDNVGIMDNCYSLKGVAITKTITNIQNSFRNCNSLKDVSIPKAATTVRIGYTAAMEELWIPDGVTSTTIYDYTECFSLRRVRMSDNVAGKLCSGCFAKDYSLESIVIPAGITSIDTYCFQNCYSMKEMHFKPASPPTVSNSNSFNNLPTDCTIYVPTGSLSAYTSATNYPDPQTYTYVEE